MINRRRNHSECIFCFLICEYYYFLCIFIYFYLFLLFIIIYYYLLLFIIIYYLLLFLFIIIIYICIHSIIYLFIYIYILSFVQIYFGLQAIIGGCWIGWSGITVPFPPGIRIYSYVRTSALSSGAPTGRATNNNLTTIFMFFLFFVLCFFC